MKFSQLRLSGFKSFVEPTELLIKDGLTGIVGPNGCGKSNLVEALRWVMGETSAKNMRGGAMDDVIFAGTTSRAPRSWAEVTLGLDNKDRAAPPAYNDTEELDITRRIRREAGSDYRINGKVTRARDVQLLFADMATGAHSTAIVSQGRVGSLINAKPKDRRHLLEEAAGISGLHSRRHEAELRLKAAENNLERVDDVSGQLEVQLGSLKRQARQATRYRNISGHIRKAEAMLLFRKYEKAAATEADARQKLKEASDAVAELTKQVALAQNASLKAGEALGPLRDADAAAAAQVNKLTLQKDHLQTEEDRILKARQQLEDRKTQISSDMEREKSLETEAAEAIEALAQEVESLTATEEAEAPTLETLTKEIDDKQAIIRNLQAELDEKTEALAAARAEQNSLEQQLAAATREKERQESKLSEIEKERLVLKNSLEQLEKNEPVEAELKTALEKSQNLQAELDGLESQKAELDQAEKDARNQLQTSEKSLAATEAEIKAIKSLLAASDQGEWTGVAEGLDVTAGYETALGAALGDDLDAPTDADAPGYWSGAAKPDQGFADKVETLDQFVKGESALAARLSQIAVVDPSDVDAIVKSLKPGQRAVTKEGDLYRWDGYRQKAGSKSAAALRLEQKNRLQDLEETQRTQEAAKDQQAEKLSVAESNAQEVRTQEKEIRQSRRAVEEELNRLRARQAEQQRAVATKTSRLQVLNEQVEALTQDISDTKSRQSELTRQQAEMSDPGEGQADLDRLRNTLREKREEAARTRSDLDRKLRDAAIRKDRIKSATQERENWIRRSSGMADHFAQLEIRFSSTDQELKDLETKPQELERLRGELMDEMARAEGKRTTIREQVAEAESVLAQCDAALRQAQDSLATCREERVRYQADVEHSEDILKSLAEQIHEKLECMPDKIKEAGGIEEGEEIPPVDVSERKVERLKKERDGMGPVNLRAEIEAKEVDEQLTTLLEERADLEAAISRLRQGIASLNKEGRERLLNAFKQVDSHFQDLFKQVFGGGYAHLKLTESEDPLAAGLEIMASPPGKRLQLMSLLSGGEQALTAVALLFAVFLTNPAPICVLDEVDAPLDDVNVERLCNLLDQLAKNSETRFLVVTHHPITMARMDRLFGVTMAERGISQLVSVDLQRARLMTEEPV
ncbi:chromosome segregation protein SMC [Sneathiella limimaris]|uniref:chromosome segregation protein SMC n=1 Tax=Sneathiella limimaris TaxID=1964213 RepID=UPI00146E97F7